jgi:hypothetical protein
MIEGIQFLIFVGGGFACLVAFLIGVFFGKSRAKTATKHVDRIVEKLVEVPVFYEQFQISEILGDGDGTEIARGWNYRLHVFVTTKPYPSGSFQELGKMRNAKNYFYKPNGDDVRSVEVVFK